MSAELNIGQAVADRVASPATSAQVFTTEGLAVYYGDFRAVRDVNLTIRQHEITAFIGPSGCGKTTVLRCFNRMNDLIDIARVEGTILYHGVDLYDPQVNPVEVRRRIGMVFQKPNPFPKSIYDNVAYGPRLAGIKKRAELDAIVEQSLQDAALWDEVKGRLKASGLSLSGGQQQRLCIARAIAVEPEVILMDEPCSALDPIATARIEDLMQEIKQQYTIIIVTHNMQQAARVSDRTAFFTTEVNPESDRRTGRMVEFGRTSKIFSKPDDERTEQYVTGKVWVTMGELRRSFHTDLETAKSELVSLAASVTEAIPRATAVLLEGDLEGADLIIRGDDEIDARSMDIEERCYRILALQAPVASDLRQVIALMKMVAEVERSADLLCNICKAARRIYGHELDPKLRGIISRMGEQAQQLYDAAIESFVENDAAKAAAIDDMDSYLDGLQKQFVQAIFESHAAGRIDLQVAVQLAVVARFYERIGDHAVNIGERVNFVVTGWLPEHKGAARYRSRLDGTGEVPVTPGAPADDQS